jgi:hypothetical protein
MSRHLLFGDFNVQPTTLAPMLFGSVSHWIGHRRHPVFFVCVLSCSFSHKIGRGSRHSPHFIASCKAAYADGLVKV